MLAIPNDSDFYRRREQQCRKMAEQALDPHIRNIHLEFAEHYAFALSESADGMTVTRQPAS